MKDSQWHCLHVGGILYVVSISIKLGSNKICTQFTDFKFQSTQQRAWHWAGWRSRDLRQRIRQAGLLFCLSSMGAASIFFLSLFSISPSSSISPPFSSLLPSFSISSHGFWSSISWTLPPFLSHAFTSGWSSLSELLKKSKCNCFYFKNRKQSWYQGKADLK